MEDNREEWEASLSTQEAPTLNRAAQTGRATEDEKLLELPKPDKADFVHTDTWRVLRITGEFVEGFDALYDVTGAVTIFGSARVLPEDPMYVAAAETARLLGEAGYTILTGGGPGIMEAGNKGAREAKARSIGLNIELPFEQHINPYVDVAVEFRYFFVRKTMLVKYACGFIIFPGGFGTMDELFEAITLIQTGKLKNFPIILYGSSYWQGLLDWMRGTMLTEGKIGLKDLDLLLVCDTPEEARDAIIRSRQDSRWRERKEEAAHAELQRVYQKEMQGG
jgi:uncharacterized protein (TIGR00730 family)